MVIQSRYRIEAFLGRGGMGIVYRAHDQVLEELVALKLLRLPDAPEAARRFRSEIKMARKVSHRNVCRIHDYGEDQGVHFISMELIQGPNIRQVLEGAGLSAGKALEVAVQVARGLEAIHEVGIIHRDLKTANIMMDAQGVVKLMDFGIAKEHGVRGGTASTVTGQIVGTPEYMSPEQARGEKVDFRTDIYALGVVLFELFTGRVPFRGETPLATILMHLHDPPPLDATEASLPPGLGPLLRQALAKERADRPPTATAVVRALQQVGSPSDLTVDDRPTVDLSGATEVPSPVTKRPGTTTLLKDPSQGVGDVRRSRVAVLSAGVAAVGLILAGMAVRGSFRPGSSGAQPQQMGPVLPPSVAASPARASPQPAPAPGGVSPSPAAVSSRPSEPMAATPPAKRSSPAPLAVTDPVQAAPDVTPPRVLGLSRPAYPPMAKRLNRETTLLVRVLVREDGKVSKAEILLGDASGLGFNEAAVEAAYRTTFAPARKQGVAVTMWTNLPIVFARN